MISTPIRPLIHLARPFGSFGPAAWRGLAFATGALALSASHSALAQTKGPSSSATPYVLPLDSRVATTSLLTVGDSVNLKPDGVTPYRMVGIPDGLGAFDNGDGTFTVLMNHEIGGTSGVVRAHGATGAFVSKYIIRKDTLQVLGGEDLIQQVATVNTATGVFNAPAKGLVFNRFCSADLPPTAAFFNDGVGFNGRIFMNGEESGPESRAFGHVVTGPEAGTSYELPRLGKFSWENSVASPASGGKTVVMGTDDATPGQVYCYIGTKTNQGNAVERAGLNNGALFGIKVTGFPVEDIASSPTRGPSIPSGTAFTLAPLGDVTAMTGAQQQAASAAAGVTEFLRPEDGAWDPNNPNHFYFNTTDRFDTTKTRQGAQVARTRLWRLKFTDIKNPELGGTIDQVLDGTGDYEMFDNMAVDNFGRVLLQEDPGGQPYAARIHQFDIASNTITPILEFDRSRFGGLSTTGTPPTVQPATAPFNNDEESSGIIDVSDIFGRGTYLFDVQAHYSLGGELVEGGQLVLLSSPPNQPLLDLDASGAGLGFSATFTEDGAPVAIGDADLLVQAGRNTTLSGATITLTNVLDGASEVLAATLGASGLTASYTNNGTTGVLTISGSASAAVYQQVLASVTYSNSSPSPTPRTITATVSSDASGAGTPAAISAPATSTISILGVADIPVLSAIETAPLSFSEDAPAAPITATLEVADVDSASLEGATVAITGGFVAGEDELSLETRNGISGTFNAATGVLTITGSATLAQYRDALRSVKYRNLNTSSPSAAARTVSFRVADDTAGTSQSVAVTRNFSVAPLNDAPVLTTNAALTVAEGSTGDVITNAMLKVDDVDNTPAQRVFTLTQAPANGTLRLNGAVLAIGGSWTQADIDARRVTFDSSGAEASGDVFKFSVSDGVGGTIGAQSFSITINAVNDAPTLSDIANVRTAEDSAPTVVNLSIGDADSPLSSLIVNATSSDTSLVPAGGIVLGGSGANRTLSIVPAPNQSGTATITVRVGDGALITAKTFVLTVDAVNDAPNAQPDSASTAYNTPLSLQVLANDADAENDALSISALDATGTRGTISISGDKKSVLFTPEAGFSGSTSFGYTVSDGAATSTARATVQVLASTTPEPPVVVNAAPVAVADAYSTRGPLVVTAANGVLRNDADANGDALRARLNSVPAHGTIRFKSDGSFLYTPAAGYTGRDAFTYAANDGQAESANVQVVLTVTAAPDTTPPVVILAGGTTRTQRQLSAARGSAADVYVVRGRGIVPTSGLRSVALQLQRTDGKYWNGRTYQTTPFDLSTRILNRAFFALSSQVPASSPGDKFKWTAIARDNAGNVARTTQIVTIDSMARG